MTFWPWETASCSIFKRQNLFSMFQHLTVYLIICMCDMSFPSCIGDAFVGTVSPLLHTHMYTSHLHTQWRYCHPSLEWSSDFCQAWYCQLFFRIEKGALFLHWCMTHPYRCFTMAICIKVTLQVHLLCITYCTIYICNEELYHCLQCMSVIFSKLGNWDTHFSAHTHCSGDLVNAVYICARYTEYRRYFIVSISFPLSVEILAYFWRSAFLTWAWVLLCFSQELIIGLTYFMPLVYFFQEQSSCHTICSLCELSLYMNTHKLENSIFKSKTEVLKKCMAGSFLEIEKKNCITSVIFIYYFVM